MNILDLLKKLGGQQSIPGFGGTNVQIPGMTPGYGDDPLAAATGMPKIGVFGGQGGMSSVGGGNAGVLASDNGVSGGAGSKAPSRTSKVFDRIMSGLLGAPNNYGGLLDQGTTANAGKDARTAMFASLLESSGQPVGLGQAIGRSIMAGRGAQNEGLEAALRANLLGSQMDKNKRADLPTSAEEYEYFKKLPPDEQKLYQEMRAKSGPAAIQEFQYFKTLSPEDQATYTKLQRQPTVPKVVMIGKVPHLVDPVTGTRTPLSSLEQEATGAATVSGAEAQAQAFGKAAGEIAGTIQQKGSDAKASQSMLEGADALIDIATGSGAGNAADTFLKFFGHSTDGATAIAELQVLQSNLMLNQPRMEGPQSDADRDLYVTMAGRIGDPNTPAVQKKAALRKIMELQNKYIERAQTAAPVSTAPAAPGGKTETAAERAKRMGL